MEEGAQTKWNSNELTVRRIDELCTELNAYNIELLDGAYSQARKYFACLDTLYYGELRPYLKRNSYISKQLCPPIEDNLKKLRIEIIQKANYQAFSGLLIFTYYTIKDAMIKVGLGIVFDKVQTRRDLRKLAGNR